MKYAEKIENLSMMTPDLHKFIAHYYNQGLVEDRIACAHLKTHVEQIAMSTPGFKYKIAKIDPKQMEFIVKTIYFILTKDFKESDIKD